jgi:DNA modification methylase
MKPYHKDPHITIFHADCRKGMAFLTDESVDCCVTSPPYWGLRDYGAEEQIGLEGSFEDYLQSLSQVFREVRRVLKNDGTLWLNLGDAYASKGGSGHQGKHGYRYNRTHTQRQLLAAAGTSGLKNKELVGIPWMVAFMLRAEGWFLRSDIIWHKPNPMPESVTHRPTKAHEYIFLLSKSEKYYYDAGAIMEPVSGSSHSRGSGLNPKAVSSPVSFQDRDRQFSKGRKIKQNASFSSSVRNLVTERNRRTVWTVASHPYDGAHFATFPPSLIRPCIQAGCPKGGVVLDPFGGSGTTGQVAKEEGRRAILFEINQEYLNLQRQRIAQECIA